MPLLVGTDVVVTPPPDIPVVPYEPIPIDLERLGAAWTAPDGTVWPLTSKSYGWWTLNAADYGGAVSDDMTTDPNPRYGERVRSIHPQSRLITWPLRITGATHTEFIGRWRALARAFKQTRRLGPGTLSVAQPDGTIRQVRAYCKAGFDQAPGAGWWYDTAIISLFCEDPYWSDPDPTVVTRRYVGAPVSFITPSFPTISSSETLGDTTVTNPGDAPAWPVWTITGPAASIVATNNTTGETFTLTPVGGAMVGGDVATITTDPPAVIGSDGVTSWIGGLNWPSCVLWGLEPGDNDVTFTVSGSGAGTSITLIFHPRYETA